MQQRYITETTIN